MTLAEPVVASHESAPEPAESAIQSAKSKIATVVSSPAFLVSALTVLAGILRFGFLDRPPIWGDEAMTFMRVSGTYREMLEALRDWGFAPLHYELYWAIRQFTELTPFMMRLPTAIAGTLMVPAMYWLAVQLAGRRVALLTALLAATSAYLCNYSRDAKMYMDFWFFATLNFACLLWWLRVRTRITWWSWVASGVAMMGLNLLGGIVLLIQVIALVVYPARQWRTLFRTLVTKDLFLLGVVLMLLGPAGYYLLFNRYFPKVDQGGLRAGGLGWVEGYNKGRHGGDLVLFTTTAYLYSWEWPRERDQASVEPTVLRRLKTAGLTILAILAVGLLPWPRRWTAYSRGADHPPTVPAVPFWRSALVILGWIILPAYAVYCMSIEDHSSPAQLVARLFAIESWSAMAIVAAIGVVALANAWFCARTWPARLLRVGMALMIALVIFGLMTLIYYLIAWFYKYDGSVWMPRYLGLMWPAVAIVVAVLLLRLPTWPVRAAAIVLIVGVNLAVFSARVFAGSEPPAGLMAQDLIDSQPDDAEVRIYYAVTSPRAGAPGQGTLLSVPGAYYLTVLSGRETSPREMISSFHGGAFERQWPRWSPSRVRDLSTSVLADLRRRDHVQRIMVWQSFTPGNYSDADPLGERLAPAWRRIDEQIFPVRDHWMWRDLVTIRRRVYERTGEPLPPPAPRPATGPSDG